MEESVSILHPRTECAGYQKGPESKLGTFQPSSALMTSPDSISKVASAKRILVIGVSGAGKSTLAGTLSHKLNLPFLRTDPLYWGENWRQVPAEQVMEAVRTHIQQEKWILDGNFEEQLSEIWPLADLIIWLDYPQFTAVGRVIRRNLGWLLTGAPVWIHNRMTLIRALSGIRHCWQSYPRKKAIYSQALPKLSSVCLLHFKSPRETAHWVQQVRLT